MAVKPPEATLQTIARLGIRVSSQPNFTVGLGSYAEDAQGVRRQGACGQGSGQRAAGHSALHDRSASINFEEKYKGTLEVGKVADLVVLGEDILTAPPDRIRRIPIGRTIVGGREIDAAR